VRRADGKWERRWVVLDSMAAADQMGIKQRATLGESGSAARREHWREWKKKAVAGRQEMVVVVDEVARQAFWPKGISGEQQRSSPVIPHLHPTRRFTLLHHGRAPPASPQSVYASIRASSAPRQWDPLKTPIAPHTTPSPPPCVPFRPSSPPCRARSPSSASRPSSSSP
jgi:hypothetical protein